MEYRQPTLEELIHAVRDQRLYRTTFEDNGDFARFTLVFIVDDEMKTELTDAPHNISFVFLGSGFNKIIFGVNVGTKITYWVLGRREKQVSQLIARREPRTRSYCGLAAPICESRDRSSGLMCRETSCSR